MNRAIGLFLSCCVVPLAACGGVSRQDDDISRYTDNMTCGGYEIRHVEGRYEEISPIEICDNGIFTAFRFGDFLPVVYAVPEGAKEDRVVNTRYFSAQSLLLAETVSPRWRIKAGPAIVEVEDTRRQPRETRALHSTPTGGVVTVDRYIPATLKTPLHSQRPGHVTASVDQAVYDAYRYSVVIPAGSRIAGVSRAFQTANQSRISVCITEIVVPDGRQLRAVSGTPDCLASMGDVWGASGLSNDDGLAPEIVVPSGTQILARPTTDLQLIDQ